MDSSTGSLFFPRSPAVNQLGHEQPVDCLSQCVFVGIALTADRWLDARLVVCVTDAQELRAPIRMVDQTVVRRLAFAHSLLQCIQNKVGLHVSAHSQAHVATGK